MHSESVRPRTGLVLTTLAVAEVLSAFELSLVYAAMGALLKEFRDPTVLGWILAAFTLASAAVVTLCSRLGDMWGRRNVLLAVIALSGAGSLISALSPNLFGVIGGRAIQGFSAAILPLCFGLIREHLPADRVPAGIGTLILTANISGAVAYLLGGMIVDHYSWQGIFHLTALVALIALIATWKLLPPGKTAPAQGAFDYLGAILFVPGVCAILFALTQGGKAGYASPMILGMFGAGVLTIVAWVRHELKRRHPLINVGLLANRQVVLTIVCLAAMCAGPMSYNMIVPMYLTQPTWNIAAGGMSATAAASVIVPSVVLGGIGALCCAPLVRRIAARGTMIVAAGLFSGAWLALYAFHGSAAIIGLLLIPQGIAAGIVMAVVPVLLNEVVALEHTSEANGLAGLFRQVAVSVGRLALGLILNAGMVAAPDGSGLYPTAEAFAQTIGVIALLALVTLVGSLALPKPGAAGPLASQAAA